MSSDQAATHIFLIPPSESLHGKALPFIVTEQAIYIDDCGIVKRVAPPHLSD
jgi:hypothetical protein